MIRPPQVEQPSPLAAFAQTIELMGANRTFLFDAVEPNWRTLLEDLAMLTKEKVIVGLRTRWARRVAVPVLAAHRALSTNLGTEQERARVAIDILKQCIDEHVRDTCTKWVKGKYHV